MRDPAMEVRSARTIKVADFLHAHHQIAGQMGCPDGGTGAVCES